MTDFRAIEERIVERIAEAVGYARHIGTYAGEFGDELRQGAVRTPSVYVVYGGSEFEPVDGWTHREVARFTIMAVARNLRGGDTAREGGGNTARERGAYELVADVLRAVVNDKAGAEDERLKPRRVTLVHAAEGVAVYGIDVEAAFDTEYAG